MTTGSDLRVAHEIVTPRTVVNELQKHTDVSIQLVEYSPEEFEKSKYIPGLGELYARCVLRYPFKAKGELIY